MNKVDLLTYLPKFIQEYREIKHIMIAENPEFQHLEDQTKIVENNMFIMTCDETGISRFEKLLGITPSPDDTLEARISRVLTRWNDSIPYTYKGLIEKLNVMCGIGNYELVPDFNNYTLTLNVCLPLSGQVDELDYMLSYMIPANIVVISNNAIERQTTGQVFTGSTVVESSMFTITSQTTKNHSLDASAFALGVIGTNIERTIN